ncbi:MAG: SRPBCC family protein [Tepidiformaceae bacterium]
MATVTTNRIEKSVLIRAPRARVWRALSNAREFGAWFGVSLEGEFAPGQYLPGKIASTGPDDPNHPYVGQQCDLWVEQMEPERLFSYRWYAYAPAQGERWEDISKNLVVFTLEDADGGTLLKIVESGFDAIPEDRRAQALEGNTEGWAMQAERIKRYVEERA